LVRSNPSPVDGARVPSAEVQAPHCWPLYGLEELQSRETLLAHLYLVVLVLLHVEALLTERLHRALLSGEGRGTHFGLARTRSSSRARFPHKRAIAYEILPPICLYKQCSATEFNRDSSRPPPLPSDPIWDSGVGELYGRQEIALSGPQFGYHIATCALPLSIRSSPRVSGRVHCCCQSISSRYYYGDVNM
jgi:hypothetical protein